MLYKKGAEAHLFKEKWYGRMILKKVRVPKSYRHPTIDQLLRTTRTIHEAKILTETRKIGVSTPVVYYIDIVNTTIIMEFIDGIRVKELLNESTSDHSKICQKIGEIIIPCLSIQTFGENFSKIDMRNSLVEQKVEVNLFFSTVMET